MSAQGEQLLDPDRRARRRDSWLADLVADWLGFEFDSPLLLPSAVNILIGLLAVAAALERALRFKRGRWLD